MFSDIYQRRIYITVALICKYANHDWTRRASASRYQSRSGTTRSPHPNANQRDAENPFLAKTHKSPLMLEVKFDLGLPTTNYLSSIFRLSIRFARERWHNHETYLNTPAVA